MTFGVQNHFKGLPFELRSSLTVQWPDPLPEFVCKLRSATTEATSYASVLTITAFSIERYLAICQPLRMRLFSKLDRAIRVIAIVWLIAIISAVPFFITAKLNRLPLPEGLNLNQMSKEVMN